MSFAMKLIIYFEAEIAQLKAECKRLEKKLAPYEKSKTSSGNSPSQSKVKTPQIIPFPYAKLKR